MLSALLAHTAAYGAGHEAGGIYHTALVLALIAASGGFAVLAVLGAVVGARTGDGSVFATLLREALPGRRRLIAVSTGWFWLIEALEPRHHEAALVVVAAALLIAASLVHALARRIIAAVAEIVIAIARPPHRERAPFLSYIFAPAPSARAVAFAYRRYARPPPV